MVVQLQLQVKEELFAWLRFMHISLRPFVDDIPFPAVDSSVRIQVAMPGTPSSIFTRSWYPEVVSVDWIGIRTG